MKKEIKLEDFVKELESKKRCFDYLLERSAKLGIEISVPPQLVEDYKTTLKVIYSFHPYLKQSN